MAIHEANSIKTKAIILDEYTRAGSNACISLYTEEEGLLNVMAYGLRSQKNSFSGILVPFSVISVVLTSTQKNSQKRIVEAQTIEDFPLLRNSLYGQTAAAYFMEVVRKTAYGNAESKIIPMLSASFDALSQNEERFSALKIVLAFEIKLLSILGFSPTFSSCLSCGEKNPLAYYSPAAGGTVCSKCINAFSDKIEITIQEINAIVMLKKTPFANCPSTDIAPKTTVSIARILYNTIVFHADKIKSRRVLEDIFSLR